MKRTFTVTGRGLLKASLFIFFIWLVSYYFHIKLQGEVSANDPLSQEIAKSLRNALASQKNLQLSLLLKKNIDNKTYVVVWPPYETPKRFKCDIFMSNDLESLEIRHPYADDFFMLTSFDSSGTITDVATIYNNPPVFCDRQPLTCIPNENAYLSVITTPKGQCYTLVSK